MKLTFGGGTDDMDYVNLGIDGGSLVGLNKVTVNGVQVWPPFEDITSNYYWKYIADDPTATTGDNFNIVASGETCTYQELDGYRTSTSPPSGRVAVYQTGSGSGFRLLRKGSDIIVSSTSSNAVTYYTPRSYMRQPSPISGYEIALVEKDAIVQLNYALQDNDGTSTFYTKTKIDFQYYTAIGQARIFRARLTPADYPSWNALALSKNPVAPWFLWGTASGNDVTYDASGSMKLEMVKA